MGDVIRAAGRFDPLVRQRPWCVDLEDGRPVATGRDGTVLRSNAWRKWDPQAWWQFLDPDGVQRAAWGAAGATVAPMAPGH